jgi:hypothetical protein
LPGTTVTQPDRNAPPAKPGERPAPGQPVVPPGPDERPGVRKSLLQNPVDAFDAAGPFGYGQELIAKGAGNFPGLAGTGAEILAKRGALDAYRYAAHENLRNTGDRFKAEANVIQNLLPGDVYTSPANEIIKAIGLNDLMQRVREQAMVIRADPTASLKAKRDADERRIRAENVIAAMPGTRDEMIAKLQQYKAGKGFSTVQDLLRDVPSLGSIVDEVGGLPSAVSGKLGGRVGEPATGLSGLSDEQLLERAKGVADPAEVAAIRAEIARRRAKGQQRVPQSK